MLKIIFVALICVWTCAVVLKVVIDLMRPGVNYYGLFFAIPTALLVVVVGNGLLLSLYWLCKRIIQRWM